MNEMELRAKAFVKSDDHRSTQFGEVADYRAATKTMSTANTFEWTTHPGAATLVKYLLDEFLERCPDAACFADRLRRETGTRLQDWVESIVLDRSIHQGLADQLQAVGFVPEDANYVHPGGMFPSISLCDVRGHAKRKVIIKVQSVVDFLAAHRMYEGVHSAGYAEIPPSFPPLSVVRMARVFDGNDAFMFVRESHGPCGDEPGAAGLPYFLEVAEMFRLRRRVHQDAAAGFADLLSLVDEAVALVGVGRACDLFFSAEREYWMSRNRAAQIQYARQQKLGLGWANHDHHTYRSSRAHFKDLITIMEKLGLVCRERFYAGKEAGWGAQVMENTDAGIVVFADVDLSPEEVADDFAHNRMSQRNTLGTVGLWCALHGESLFEAGMHHLECQFDFSAARDQLRNSGVNSMKPFTDFEFLKQAFTEGEMWPVNPKRIDALLQSKLITFEQATRFRLDGAIGSHLEILQRDDGYKGFNQTGINEIILKTDPRHTH